MKGLETLDQKVRSDGDEELGGEQRQVLQTRIVSLKEVEERKEEWKPMLKEMMALAEEKEAVTRLSAKEAHELLEVDREVQMLPGKVVCTVKPGGKKKCRIVVCGNFGESHQEGQCLYASGTDVIGLRVAIKEAARRRWKGGTVDVRCAFLSAPPGGGEWRCDDKGGNETSGHFGSDGLDRARRAVGGQSGFVWTTPKSEMLGHLSGHEDEELEVSQRWPTGQTRADDERAKCVAGQGRSKDRRREGGDGWHHCRVCGRYDGAGTGGDRDGGV